MHPTAEPWCHIAGTPVYFSAALQLPGADLWNLSEPRTHYVVTGRGEPLSITGHPFLGTARGAVMLAQAIAADIAYDTGNDVEVRRVVLQATDLMGADGWHRIKLLRVRLREATGYSARAGVPGETVASAFLLDRRGRAVNGNAVVGGRTLGELRNRLVAWAGVHARADGGDRVVVAAAEETVAIVSTDRHRSALAVDLLRTSRGISIDEPGCDGAPAAAEPGPHAAAIAQCYDVRPAADTAALWRSEASLRPLTRFPEAVHRAQVLSAGAANAYAIDRLTFRRATADGALWVGDGVTPRAGPGGVIPVDGGSVTDLVVSAIVGTTLPDAAVSPIASDASAPQRVAHWIVTRERLMTCAPDSRKTPSATLRREAAGAGRARRRDRPVTAEHALPSV